MRVATVIPCAFVISLALSIAVPSANAQYNAAVDVSKCYSPILQRSDTWQNDENTHYRLMSYMSKQDYESLQANGQAQAFIKGIPLARIIHEDIGSAQSLVRRGL
jgi:hypothetical protein